MKTDTLKLVPATIVTDIEQIKNYLLSWVKECQERRVELCYTKEDIEETLSDGIMALTDRLRLCGYDRESDIINAARDRLFKPVDVQQKQIYFFDLEKSTNEAVRRLRDILTDVQDIVKADRKKDEKLTADSGGKAGDGKETDKQADLAKVPISELIKQGESHMLEFKETLEYDTHQSQGNKDVLHSSLKTIAGFLNAKGGSMLIGVDDLGKIRGVKRDLSIIKRGNNDRFEQKIRNCLRDRFKPQPIGKVNISFEKFTEGTVCRVDVQKSKEIVHLDNEVYLRDGNTTPKLEGRQLIDWVQQRGQAANIGNGS